MAGKYKINRSNYTVRGRHQLFSGGVIYERDFMTTTNLGPWDSGSIPYGEGNFRMLYRRTENARKRPRSGSWLEHGSTGSSDSTVWTAGCVEKTGVTEEKSIRIKPNYNSMLDFAYYGSCQELVKSTIRGIINDFPGELIAKQTNGFKINGEDYLLVENPFNVDVFDDGDDKGIKNFARNFKRYRIVGVGAVDSCTITKETGCTHGDITATAVINPRTGSPVTIYKIIYGSEPMLFTKSHGGIEIRPDDEALEEFFESLDDFGRLLLNRESYPKYTATIDWPHETDYGVKTYRRAFTWPMDGEWNLDVVSETYGNYIDELLSIAEFYDEGYTDNLWRMLTHDSIKSMDLAFSNPLKDEDKADYNIGTTRLEGLLWAYGRQFDELKRSIDNIKFTSNITYDGNNNLPDYFLSDTLELSGWEVYNVDRGIEGQSTDVSWSGITSGIGISGTYTSEYANNLFLRELKLNSKDILKKKGTRDGVMSLLGLFGMVYGEDYEIHEEVAVVNGDIETKLIGEQFDLERLNSLKASFETSTEAEGFNIFDGIPFTYVENGSTKYIIPWFDDNLTYDGGMYFQMYGGWEKFGEKYGETLKYLTIVDKKTDLYTLPVSKQYKGSVCYCEEDEKYYELKDESNAGNEGGWTSGVSQSKIDYLESLTDDFTGNNPHVGYGKYDNGKEYIERIRVPFSYHVSANTKDNPMFSDAAYDCNGNYDNGFKKEFSIESSVTDDKKVWFFGEWIDGKTSSERTGGIWRCCPNDDTSSISQQGKTASASMPYNTYDFEKHSYSTSATEASANSIINTKGLRFTFYIPLEFLSDFTKYLKDVILPYLRQVLPSSALWRYEIKTKERIPVQTNETVESPLVLVVDGIAYGNGNTDINDDVIVNYSEDHNVIFDNNG